MNFLKKFLDSQTFWKYPSSRATLLQKTTKISWNQYYLSYFWQWAVKFAARPCCNITTFTDRNLCWEKIYILYACVMWPFKTFFSSVFDCLLYRPPTTQDIQEYSDVQRVLREEIVNPLRKNWFVRADRVMKLRQLLDKLTSVSGLLSEEKGTHIHTMSYI